MLDKCHEMSRLDKIWADLNSLTTESQVLSYWDNRQTPILESLKDASSDSDITTKIIHRLAKALNDREKYSSIFYLYKAGYQPVESKLASSETLSELKFELGRGLHHNRKYDHSKKLFNELAASGFDTTRIDNWWSQTAFASTRDKIWIKTDVLPALGSFAIMVAYLLAAVKTNEFLISTTLFIILFELYETWWHQYRVSSYLKESEGSKESDRIKKDIKKRIFVELAISLLFYPIYFLKEEWFIPLILIVAAYFQVFHYGLNAYYLPKIVAELNREKAHADSASIHEHGVST